MKRLGNQKGFTAFEVVIIIVALAAISATGYFAYQARQDKTDYSVTVPKKTAQKADTASYLTVKEKGIKFKLSNDIKDAYYYVSSQGYVYFSLRSFDGLKGAEGCSAKGESGDGGGVVALVDYKVGDPQGEQSDIKWTQAELDKSGLTKVGSTYYGFMRGNGLCYNPDAVDSATAANYQARVDAAIKAFNQQVPTIVKAD